MWRRVVSKQRAGLSFDQNAGEEDGEDEDVHASLLGGGNERRRARSAYGVQDRVKSFVDGVANWINLQMGWSQTLIWNFWEFELQKCVRLGNLPP
jgi:hypothetical protein